MTLAVRPESGSIVLEDVSWEFYERMLKEIGDGNTRLTFDQGRLEIVSPLDVNESAKTALGRLVEAYGDAMDITVEGLGSTTFKRKDLQKGLEPDECYYIAHAADVIGRKRKLNLAVDPPPDLAIEIDITHRSVPRQPIYAALRVAEVWRYDGEAVETLHRTRVGGYRASDRSLSFPDLPMEQVNRIARLALSKGQSVAIKSFRRWLKDNAT